MKRRILLADDSVTIQKVIELTFMDEDYEVRAVSNGDEALAALPEVDPHLVIADVHMPGATGYEVCRRSKELRAEVPVLLLVGTFEPFDEAQAKAAGADSFLKKPFDSQELLHRVGELVQKSSPPAPAPAAEAPAEAPFAGHETLRMSDLPSMAELSLTPSEPEPPPMAPAAPAEEWRGFELEPEPEPFAGAASEISLDADEETFGLSAPSPDWDAPPPLPGGEQMFELDEEPAAAAEASAGDVFGFEALSPVEDRLTDTERLGVPEHEAPLVGSLEETEARIEQPPPLSLDQAHEPQAAPPAPAAAAPVAPAPPAAAVAAAPAAGNGGLSDADVDRIARRVVELLGDRAVRDVAWEVIPDLAEVVIRDRLRELESQVESFE